MGLRLSALEPLFADYFREANGLPGLVDELVRSGELVAAHLTWTKKPENVHSYSWSAKVDQVARLRSFPDTVIAEDDPILYLPGRFPSRLEGRLGKIQRALDKILAD